MKKSSVMNFTNEDKDVLQFDMELLRAKWQGLAAEIQAREEHANRLNTELKNANKALQKKTEVVGHSTLLQDVLGYKGDVETKALVMHIANMRKKMAKLSLSSVKIETVAGVGYKLIEV